MQVIELNYKHISFLVNHYENLVNISPDKDKYQDGYLEFYRLQLCCLLGVPSDNYTFLGVELDRRLVASCAIKVNEQGPIICSVFTEEQYRNKGIQTMILKRSLEWLKDRGFKTVRLNTVEGSDAHKLYQNLGFENIGPCINKTNQVSMQRKLN